MARVDATAAKAAAALAAAQLQVILQDDTLEELAVENKPNHSPLRDLEKMFVVGADGTVISRDSYIDNSYAGDYPLVFPRTKVQGGPSPITLVSADIEIAAPADIVLVFSTPMSDVQTAKFSVGGAAGALKKIVAITYDSATITLTMDSAFIAADVATVSGRMFGNRNNYVDLTDEAVTNNIV